MLYHDYLAEVKSSRTSLASRAHFEVLAWPWPQRSSPWPEPRSLKSSKIALSSARGQHFFEPLKFCWKTPETLRKIGEDLCLFSSIGDRLKKLFLRPLSPEKNFWRLFFEIAWKKIWTLFFLENTCACVFGLWPWPRVILSLALRGSVLRRAVLGLGLGFFCVLGLEPTI